MSRAPSRLRRAAGLARRIVMPVLALAAAAFAVDLLRSEVAYRVARTSGDPAASVFGTIGLLLALIALPIMLFAMSGLRLRRWWRAGAAVLIAVYAAVMAPSVKRAGLAISDAVRLEPIPDEVEAQQRMGWAIVRAHPDAEEAARRALRLGDDRFYGIDALGLYPPGIRGNPGMAEYSIALKRMPGFSDSPESTPEAVRYYREVKCWVFRYDTVVAHRIGQEVALEPHVCDAVRAAR